MTGNTGNRISHRWKSAKRSIKFYYHWQQMLHVIGVPRLSDCHIRRVFHVLHMSERETVTITLGQQSNDVGDQLKTVASQLNCTFATALRVDNSLQLKNGPQSIQLKKCICYGLNVYDYCEVCQVNRNNIDEHVRKCLETVSNINKISIISDAAAYTASFSLQNVFESLHNYSNLPIVATLLKPMHGINNLDLVHALLSTQQALACSESVMVRGYQDAILMHQQERLSNANGSSSSSSSSSGSNSRKQE